MTYLQWAYVHLLLALPVFVGAVSLFFQWPFGWFWITAAVALALLAWLFHAHRALRWMLAGAAVGLVAGSIAWWLGVEWWTPSHLGWWMIGAAVLAGLFVPLIWWERR